MLKALDIFARITHILFNEEKYFHLSLSKHYPAELSVMAEIFSFCFIQTSSHWPHVAAEYLKYG